MLRSVTSLQVGLSSQHRWHSQYGVSMSTDPSTSGMNGIDPPERVLLVDLAESVVPAMVRGASPVVVTRFVSLDAALLASVLPAWVGCPLLGPGFDAIQVAQRLVSLGYAGRLVVISPALPDPKMVERELRTLSPGLRLDLMTAA